MVTQDLLNLFLLGHIMEQWWWPVCLFIRLQTWCKLEMNWKCKHINKHSFMLELLSYKKRKKKQIKELKKLKENRDLLRKCMMWKLTKWLPKTIFEQKWWLRKNLIEWKYVSIDKLLLVISLTISRVYSQWIKILVTSLVLSLTRSETIFRTKEPNH